MNSTLTNLNDWYEARYGILIADAGLLLLAFFVLKLESRHVAAKHKKQQQALSDFIFPDAYSEEVRKRDPQLTQEEIGQAFEQLRVYFLRCWQQSPKAVALPTQLIDLCWHTFILDTRQYHRFCNAVFGKYLHHDSDAIEGKSSAAYSDLPAPGVICADLASCSGSGAASSSDGCSGSD